MARRSGQSGYVTKKRGVWWGRWYADIPGLEKRTRKAIPLGPISELSKSQAKLKLRTYLEEQGVNSVAPVVKPVPKPVPAWTFADQAAWWEKNKLALLSQSFQDSRGIYLKQHLVPYFGPTPVTAISEQQAQECIAHLTRRKLAASTISSIISTLKAIVGEKIWRDWELTLPRALEEEQRYFTPDEMRRIVEGAKGCRRAFKNVEI